MIFYVYVTIYSVQCTMNILHTTHIKMKSKENKMPSQQYFHKKIIKYLLINT